MQAGPHGAAINLVSPNRLSVGCGTTSRRQELRGLKVLPPHEVWVTEATINQSGRSWLPEPRLTSHGLMPLWLDNFRKGTHFEVIFCCIACSYTIHKHIFSITIWKCIIVIEVQHILSQDMAFNSLSSFCGVLKCLNYVVHVCCISIIPRQHSLTKLVVTENTGITPI